MESQKGMSEIKKAMKQIKKTVTLENLLEKVKEEKEYQEKKMNIKRDVMLSKFYHKKYKQTK